MTASVATMLDWYLQWEYHAKLWMLHHPLSILGVIVFAIAALFAVIAYNN